MMTGRVVMDAYGSAAGFGGVARGNLTLSRRSAGTVPAEPHAASSSFIDGLSPPHRAHVPGPAAICAPPPVRKRVEVAEP
jgi:hypothetical protein